MRPLHLVLLLAMNLCWGAVYSAYKLIGDALPPGAIVTLRFGLAGVCLLCCWPWLPGDAPRGRALARTCLMGAMLYVIGQRLQVYGNAIGSAANSAVLIALEPITTSLAAAMFLREHIGPRRIAGFLLGMAGVALLNGAGRPDFSWGSLGASLIFASSFICEAAYSVMGKTIVQRFSVMKMLAISILIGTAINLLIDGHSTIAAAKGLSVPLWGLIITMAIVCTAIGYSLWFVVIRDCPVNVAALTIFAQALFGVLIAAVWLHEKLRAAQLWGGLIIVAGMAIGLSRQIKVNGGRADETSKSKLQNS